jgi:hypothetical protein
VDSGHLHSDRIINRLTHTLDALPPTPTPTSPNLVKSTPKTQLLLSKLFAQTIVFRRSWFLG